MTGTARRQWYQIKNTVQDDQAAEVLIYGEIDSIFGVDAADFIKDLAAIDAPEILVRINSPGGDIFDGVAILNALRGRKAHITTQVDSLAASAASVIAMAGDEIVMNANSQLMLHNAWALVVGNSNDMQRAADMLERQNDNIADIYAQRAGGTTADWRAVMDDETWMTADEAVDAGLADSIITLEPKASTAAARAAASFDRSRFRYDGRQSAPAPQIAARIHATDPNHEQEAAVPSENPQFSRQDDERFVDAAIRDGKIMASGRQDWLGRLKQDPSGFRSMLNAMMAVPGLNSTPSPADSRAPQSRTRPTPRGAATSKDWNQDRTTPVLFNPSGEPIHELVERGRPRSEWTEQELREEALWKLGPQFRNGLKPPPKHESYVRDLTQPHLVENSDGTWHWEKTDPYA